MLAGGAQGFFIGVAAGALAGGFVGALNPWDGYPIGWWAGEAASAALNEMLNPYDKLEESTITMVDQIRCRRGSTGIRCQSSLRWWIPRRGRSLGGRRTSHPAEVGFQIVTARPDDEGGSGSGSGWADRHLQWGFRSRKLTGFALSDVAGCTAVCHTQTTRRLRAVRDGRGTPRPASEAASGRSGANAPGARRREGPREAAVRGSRTRRAAVVDARE